MRLKLKEIREYKRMTQINLAERCNITQASISQIENMERTPSVELTEKIARALNVDKMLLFEDGYKDFLKFSLKDLAEDFSIKSLEKLVEYAELLRLGELQHGGLYDLKKVVESARGRYAASPPMKGF